MSKHTHRQHQPQRPRGPDVRREHGGMPRRPDDEELARRAEAERAGAGLTDYDPAEVPPATDAPARRRITRTGQYATERDEIGRELAEGELEPDQLRARSDRRRYPPTRYGT